MWKAPYPAKFELVVGSASYVVSPRWRRDVLDDLKAAIDDSKAPVSTSIEAGEEAFLLTPKKAGKLALPAGVDTSQLTPVVDLGRACIRSNPDWPDRLNASLHLLLDDREQPAIQLTNVRREDALSTLRSALQANPAIAVEVTGNELCITALESRVSSIQLLYDRADPFSNVLSNTVRITRIGTVPKALVKDMKLRVLVDDVPVDIANVYKTAESDPVSVRLYRADSLVLTSRRLGLLELRYTSGVPETNILNEPVKASWATIRWLMQPSLWGIVLTWILLSLGAPFWYDTLKDMLKLHSSLASKEEVQRKDRQTDTPSDAASAGAKK